MSFRAFTEYVEMYLAGKLPEDATYRSYDLAYGAGEKRLRNALRKAGFRHSEVSVSLAECAARLRERQLEVTEAAMQECLIEWYTWQRIVDGEIMAWRRR